MTNNLPQRKRPAHPPPVSLHNRPVVLFVSVSLRDRNPILANDRMHAALRQAWGEAGQWLVGRYLIMPDHVHLFCVPGVLHPVDVRMWVKYWKGRVRRILSLDESVWQRDCWDTQIRDLEHYIEKVDYMRENPVRKQLVAHTDAWPFQGELQVIRW